MNQDFVGTHRFEVLAPLGKGGFGDVYEARDRSRNEIVALKTLRFVDPSALQRFKQEFRALTDFVHPNVVPLYELLSDGQLWFFTMQRVRGQNLLTYVRPDAEAVDASTYDLDAPRALEQIVASPNSATLGPPDLERTRQVLVQLCEAVEAIHTASLVHRDLKPSNLYVTGTGRLMVLDFGLVAAVEAGAASALNIGTPGFLAPETATDGSSGPASDWYAVGAVLYQTLTGRLPFVGTAQQVLQAKCSFDPQDPRDLVPELPEDLCALCMQLLHRDPDQRATGRQIRELLGGAAPNLPTQTPPFVGRQREFQELQSWLGTPGAAFLQVTGEAGVGKSRLVHEVLRQTPDLLVLEGRIFEQESVPFKALDHLVDSLAHVLDEHLIDSVSRDRDVAGALFPVLATTDGDSPRLLQALDRQELQRRAAIAIKSLLARLAERRQLVLVLDDVQWGDPDSAALLQVLFQPPDPLPAKLLTTCREAGMDSSIPSTLMVTAAHNHIPYAELSLSPLGRPEAQQLLTHLAGELADAADEILEVAKGNPFYLDGLVRYGNARQGSLTALIEQRVHGLAPQARAVLATITCSPGPIPLRLIYRIHPGADTADALTELRYAHLVQLEQQGQSPLARCYHHRVKAALLDTMRPELRRNSHAALARAIEAEDPDDVETLLHCYLGAEAHDQAVATALAAADQASHALAFNHAAALYQTAIELGAAHHRASVYADWADVLALAGRCLEAALAYRQAAERAKGSAALDAWRKCGEQYLAGGHFEAGMNALRHVLKPLRAQVPATSAGALLQLLANRHRVTLRGLQPDLSHKASRAELLWVDTSWSIASALSTVDFIRGTDFQARHLLAALDCGDSRRAARALCLEAAYRATSGELETSNQLLEQAHELAPHQPEVAALGHLTRGTANYLRGRWQSSRDELEQAEELLVQATTESNWAWTSAVTFQLESWTLQGRWGDLGEVLPERLGQAQSRGNQQLETVCRYLRAAAWLLACDQADNALDEARILQQGHAHSGFHVSHWLGYFAEVQIHLYADRPEDAWKLLRGQWLNLHRSLILQVDLLAASSTHQRARAALGMAVKYPSWRRHFLCIARRDAAWLRRVWMPWAQAWAPMLEAAASAIDGDTGQARALLLDAEGAYQALDMGLFHATARLRRGQLMGDEALIADAEAAMTERGIHNPHAIAALFGSPGAWPTRSP